MYNYISTIVIVVGKVLFDPLIFALYTNTDNELTGFFRPCTVDNSDISGIKVVYRIFDHFTIILNTRLNRPFCASITDNTHRSKSNITIEERCAACKTDH